MGDLQDPVDGGTLVSTIFQAIYEAYVREYPNKIYLQFIYKKVPESWPLMVKTMS